MQPKIISIFSFQYLKFVPLRIGTKFTLADTEATEAMYKIRGITYYAHIIK